MKSLTLKEKMAIYTWLENNFNGVKDIPFEDAWKKCVKATSIDHTINNFRGVYKEFNDKPWPGKKQGVKTKIVTLEKRLENQNTTIEGLLHRLQIVENKCGIHQGRIH